MVISSVAVDASCRAANQLFEPGGEMIPKNILLIEPGYPNKYPPLGLMKLASYHGANGRGDNVTFGKGETPWAMTTTWDRVYVTTLFSFEWMRTSDAIDFAIGAARGQQERVFVGGIAASLMHDEFLGNRVGQEFVSSRVCWTDHHLWRSSCPLRSSNSEPRA